MSSATYRQSESMTVPMIVWGLYLVALFTALAILVGVIVAYIARGGAGYVERTHYASQIWAFWLMLFWFALGWILHFVLIGYLIWAVLRLWLFVRSLRGLVLASRGHLAPGF